MNKPFQPPGLAPLILRVILPLMLAATSPAFPTTTAHAGVWPFKAYSNDDGLTQSVVQDIIQDSRGYLWFATQDGVSRFDGLEFTTLAVMGEQLDVSALSLLEDSLGRLWIGTDGEGLYCLHDGVMELFEAPGGREENTIHALFENGDGVIYAVPQQGGVYLFDQGRMLRMPISAEPVGRVLDACFLSGEDILLGSDVQGLLRIRDGLLEIHSHQEQLLGKGVLAVLETPEGDQWLGLDGGGLCRVRDNRARCWTVEDGLAGNVVRDVFQDDGGVVWAATDGGVSRITATGPESFTRENGLPVDMVLTIFQDREGKMWFGTYGGGAVRLETEMFEHFTPDSGLPESLVYAISEDDQGGFYFGTSGGGVGYLLDGSLSTLDTSDGLAGNTVYSIRRDANSQMWFASYGQGVSYRLGDVFINLSSVDGLASDKVFYILNDSRGFLWFATQGGVSIYHGGEFTSLTSENGLPTDEILSILEDSSGRMWFSTYTSGVVSLSAAQADALARGDLEPENLPVTTYTEEDGLPSNKVYAMFEDREGVLWFGTDRGLARLRQGRFSVFTTRDGLSNNNCYSIIQDDRGYLWIGTSQGLNRFDQEQFRVYTVRDGLIANEFNDGAVFRDSAGRIWLGTIKGVTRLDPVLDVAEHTPPPIYIEKVSANENTVDLDGDATFEHDRNFLRFTFAAPYFSSPRDLRYRYMLEGLDHDWRETDQSSVQYASLPPGEYRFRVQSRNRDNVFSEEEATFAFAIRPPFWLAPWFLAVSVVLFGSLVYGAYRFQVRRVRERNEQLEKLIKERTRDLEEEKNTSERLLCNILPVELVGELKENGRTTPRRYDNVSILFTDFTGFTTTTSTLPAEHLVGELNEMFNAFDDIVDRLGLEKIKTIGDAYMVAGGLPKESEDHALKCVKAALAMQEYLRGRNEVSMIKWQMRAGIHSGTVIAGVVGRLKFTYDVWGNTVNIASRMENAGEPGRLNVSAFTYFLVRDHVLSEYRGKIGIKGKGEMDMYFVNGLKEPEVPEE